jgi:hypothetical protein
MLARQYNYLGNVNYTPIPYYNPYADHYHHPAGGGLVYI